MPRARLRPSRRIQRKRTIVKRTAQSKTHFIRPTYPAVVVSANGRVSAASSRADAVAEAARMLVDQLTAEGKHLTVTARVAVVAAGAAVC
jgi:hypothetical protein